VKVVRGGRGHREIGSGEECKSFVVCVSHTHPRQRFSLISGISFVERRTRAVGCNDEEGGL